MEHKEFIPFGERTFQLAHLKATGSKTSGRFEAIVAVFDNIDEGLDRIRKGAFVETLKAPPDGRGFPPVVWSHLWGVVPIGASMQAEEVEGVKTDKGEISGLFIDGELLVSEHQTAKEVYAAMRQKGGDGLPPLREFSFAYRAAEYEMVEETPTLDDGTEGEALQIRDLLQLDLYEVGPTLVGMNPMTALLNVKSGGKLSADDVRALERFAEAAEGLKDVLPHLPTSGGNGGKDDGPPQPAPDAVTDLLAAFPR